MHTYVIHNLWQKRIGISLLLIYILCIPAANWSIEHLGDSSGYGPRTLPVGFGLNAPSGIWTVALALTLRDEVQERLGKAVVLWAILLGALLSALVSPQFAFASGAAFLVSEVADMAVYTPLRQRTWLGAVALSNTLGLVVDSALFLWLAFGSVDFLAGQVVGKFYMTALAVFVLWAVRMRRDPPKQSYQA